MSRYAVSCEHLVSLAHFEVVELYVKAIKQPVQQLDLSRIQ